MLVLSIKPRFARMILLGEKTVELRRRVPRCATDFWIAIYSSSPERAMIGVVRAIEVRVAPPDELWKTVQDECGIAKDEYLGYFKDASRAVGINLSDPISFERPITLDQLRRSWPGFRPPQSFSYLSEAITATVWDHARVCLIRGEAG